MRTRSTVPLRPESAAWRRIRAATVLAALALLAACSSEKQLRRQFRDALAHQRDGNRVEARVGYDLLLAADPGTRGARNNLAVLDVADGQLATAIERLRAEVRASPELTAARANLVRALALSGEPDTAVDVALGGASEHPDAPGVQLALGLVLVQLERDPKRARAALETAIGGGDAAVRASAYFARGVLHARAGHWEQSAGDFAEVTRLRRDAVAHFDRAVALAESGRLGDALSETKVSASLDPLHPAPRHLEAVVLQRLGHGAEALTAVKSVLDADPLRPGANLLLGVLHYEAGRLSEAAEAFERELRISPNMPDVHFDLAMVRLAADDFERALSSFSEAARLDPSDAQAAHNRDQLERILGR